MTVLCAAESETRKTFLDSAQRIPPFDKPVLLNARYSSEAGTVAQNTYYSLA